MNGRHTNARRQNAGGWDARWVGAGAVAAALCALFTVSVLGVDSRELAEQVYSGGAWLSLITALVCLVRGGFDGGVHRRHTGRR